jgi:hypothetical protein
MLKLVNEWLIIRKEGLDLIFLIREKENAIPSDHSDLYLPDGDNRRAVLLDP